MTFLGLPSFRTAQTVAQTGLDGFIIDCEHGHTSDDAMHSATAAIASMGVSPLVRILGYVPARGDEPEFVDAIEKIVAAARKHKKWVGRLSNDGKASKEHFKVFDTVALSYDVRATQNWYFAELEAARGD